MDVESDSYMSNMFHIKPVRPDMMYYISSEQTYDNWPKQMAQKSNELIHNGFYYTNIGDRVTCFYCGVTLKQWTKCDNVENEHLNGSQTVYMLKWFPAKYLILMQFIR